MGDHSDQPVPPGTEIASNSTVTFSYGASLPVTDAQRYNASQVLFGANNDIEAAAQNAVLHEQVIYLVRYVTPLSLCVNLI